MDNYKITLRFIIKLHLIIKLDFMQMVAFKQP